MPYPSRSELGDFLRSRREQLRPSTVNLPDGRRRRTPGLRREEVAERAGIGVDWYIRIEQGRAVNPSANTVDALARALRLGRVEHGHLRALASNPHRCAFVRETVPDAIVRMVDRLAQPAYVTGRRWDVLAWNAAAADLVIDFAALRQADRNILAFMLTDSDARRLFGDTWAVEAQRMVAQFRTTHDLWAGDPAFDELVARLHAASPEFAIWWNVHEVRVGASGHKLLHHPRLGRLHFEYTTFQANDDASLKLAIYTPV